MSTIETEGETKGRTRFAIGDFSGQAGVLRLEYTKGNGEAHFDTSDLPEEVRNALAAFGLNVYLSRSRGDADSYESVKATDQEVWAELLTGEFSPGEGRATTGGKRIADLAEAVASVLSADREMIYGKLLELYKRTVTNKESTAEDKSVAKAARRKLSDYEAKEDVALKLAEIKSRRAKSEGRATDLSDLLS